MAKKMTGIVAQFGTKGYGFITGDDGEKYFVHQKNVYNIFKKMPSRHRGCLLHLRNPATSLFRKCSNRNSSARRKVDEKLFCSDESLEGEKRFDTVLEFLQRPGTEKPGNLEKKRRRTPNIRRVQNYFSITKQSFSSTFFV